MKINTNIRWRLLVREFLSREIIGNLLIGVNLFYWNYIQAKFVKECQCIFQEFYIHCTHICSAILKFYGEEYLANEVGPKRIMYLHSLQLWYTLHGVLTIDWTMMLLCLKKRISIIEVN